MDKLRIKGRQRSGFLAIDVAVKSRVDEFCRVRGHFRGELVERAIVEYLDRAERLETGPDLISYEVFA